MRLSGKEWVSEFPTSRDVADLAKPFRDNVERFIGALRSAGAAVMVSATYRPPERAHLMHYAFQIAKAGQDPHSVPTYTGVDIEWAHTGPDGKLDVAATRQAAEDMVRAYGIVYAPALTSRHTQGLAIDMNIAWFDMPLRIKDASGTDCELWIPRSGAESSGMHKIGASYGVVKLLSDPPHWSSDGH